jgi:3-methyladenine DNA glycosylase
VPIAPAQATPIATTPVQDTPALPQAFFARPAQLVAPDLIGCLLVKRQASGDLLWGVAVETEAYAQDDPACHGYRRRSPQNETLFGEPGRFYVVVSYGIHHCVNVVLPHPTSGAQPCRRACASLQLWQRRLRCSPWPIRP